MIQPSYHEEGRVQERQYDDIPQLKNAQKPGCLTTNGSCGICWMSSQETVNAIRQVPANVYKRNPIDLFWLATLPTC